MIGEHVRSFRTKAKYTQKKLGELVGCHPNLVSKWESGKTIPSPESIQKLIAIFGNDFAAHISPVESTTAPTIEPKIVVPDMPQIPMSEAMPAAVSTEKTVLSLKRSSNKAQKTSYDENQSRRKPAYDCFAQYVRYLHNVSTRSLVNQVLLWITDATKDPRSTANFSGEYRIQAAPFCYWGARDSGDSKQVYLDLEDHGFEVYIEGNHFPYTWVVSWRHL